MLVQGSKKLPTLKKMLAYYAAECITAVKSVMIEAPRAGPVLHNFLQTL